MKEIKIIKNRSDIGAGTRGSDLGIDAIEIAAINAGSDFFNQHSYVDVPTSNEAVYEKQYTPYALRIGKVREVCENLCNYVMETLKEEKFPLILSGDHSSALGTISGLKCTYPDKRIGVVWIDAHADMHSPYTTPSGNVHGMPLAAALGDDNMDCKRNSVTATTFENWEAIKNIGGIQPKILHSDLVYFGVRDTEEQEDINIIKHKIKNYKVEEVRFRGLEICVSEAVEKLKNVDYIYISFDVDSMDCDLISKGTGTPVSKGFDQVEIKQIIKGIISSRKLACLEIVEVNPCLDNRGNAMAEAAFDIINDVTKLI
ncbi:MAG: arginase [Flavobacteriales bacterium]|nr:arginase [Flavobacteriales bacterium]